MAVSEAQKRATTKYEHLKYKKICLRLPMENEKSELYNSIQDAADRAGLSLNAFILEAVKEKINKSV